MPAIKLKDITQPVFEIELHDGNVKKYDPWKLQNALAEVHGTTVGQPDAMYDGIRKTFGFPTEAEAKESGQYTLSCHDCLEVENALGEYVDSLPVSKKILARMSSGSSSDSPSRS